MRERAARQPGFFAEGSLAERLARLRARLIGSPAFSTYARRAPVLRGVARRDGQALFDLMSGFVYSQVIAGCVELDLVRALADEGRTADELAVMSKVPPARMRTLCDAASAIQVLRRCRDGRYRLDRFGAAILSTPGLEAMIRHHGLLYRDLTDPVGLMRGDVEPNLASFWPYVSGKDAEPDAAAARAYSQVMAASQALIAEETLRVLDLRGVQCLLDAGGGDGSFLAHAARKWPEIDLRLFELPEVAAVAADRFRAEGVSATAIAGSFDEGSLPAGADTITLVRVLFDHDDARVEAILRLVFDALPAGGRIVISEPMAGARRPTRAGDAYFGFYTMAMTTGRPRSSADHAERLRFIGFERPRVLRGTWPFITTVMTARKPKR